MNKDEPDRISKILVDGCHPNVDPKTKVFCSPINFNNIKLYVPRNFDMIEEILSKFYLDSSYFSKSETKTLLTENIEFSPEDIDQLIPHLRDYL